MDQFKDFLGQLVLSAAIDVELSLLLGNKNSNWYSNQIDALAHELEEWRATNRVGRRYNPTTITRFTVDNKRSHPSLA